MTPRANGRSNPSAKRQRLNPPCATAGAPTPNAAPPAMQGLRNRPGGPPIDLYAQGGSHRETKAFSKRGEQESNHTPPQAAYRGTPYEHLHPDNMPAISMAYNDHRNKKQGIGSATSTGSGQESKVHRQEVNQLMRQGNFAAAMISDHNDIKNTTAPNFGAYVPALAASTAYAKDQGLITPAEATQVLDALRKNI
jgi:hypothetical protein